MSDYVKYAVMAFMALPLIYIGARLVSKAALRSYAEFVAQRDRERSHRLDKETK